MISAGCLLEEAPHLECDVLCTVNDVSSGWDVIAESNFYLFLRMARTPRVKLFQMGTEYFEDDNVVFVALKIV